MIETDNHRMYTSGMRSQPNYGIDGPGEVRVLLWTGSLLLIIGLLFPRLHISMRFGQSAFRLPLGAILLVTAGLLLLDATIMLLYASRGKFRHRDRMLNLINWKGDEVVLDVGTGRGLLLVGAAKRLATGHAVGIDIWSQKDLSGNSCEVTQLNLELEGVASKASVCSQDARKLSFPDRSFDVVVSNLCIHNIPGRTGREDACHEIARVLKSGGIALISDHARTRSYATVFRSLGLDVRRIGPHGLPLLRIVIAKKDVTR